MTLVSKQEIPSRVLADFISDSAEDLGFAKRAEKPVLVVIGNGMVGHYFLNKAKENGLCDVYEIVVIGAEDDPAYDRVALSSYMTNASRSDLSLVGPEDYKDLTVYLGEEVSEIDRSSKKVLTQSGKRIKYDLLVLATGSVPFVPNVKGFNLTYCHVYRTFNDLDKIRHSAKSCRRAVVVGGGLLGLEAAGALRELGVAVDILEFADRPLPLQLDEGGGATVRRYLEEMDLGLYFSVGLASIESDESGKVSSVVLSDNRRLQADMVVFATGVRPADQLARQSGLEIGPKGGVAVDPHCQSSDPSIFAIGECASVNGVSYGLVAPGNQMAAVLAEFLSGRESMFESADMSTKLKLLGVEVASFGDYFGQTEGSLDVTFMDSISKTYKKLILSNDARRLLGGILVGDVSSYGVLRTMVGSSTDLEFDVEQLLLPGNGSPIGVGKLDAGAIVCSCNNVSFAQIRSTIVEGECWDLGSLKMASKAGTGCGSCIGLVKSILEDQCASAGLEVSKAVCEHFNYSRQELFDLISVKGIETFNRLITEYGSGIGCDICKPMVASIFASRYSRHPHHGEMASLQDTNDFVLANLQKDGSYSVVPRIPAGEITPEGLVIIGTIAREFNLYTKITGAQRIDMFGARLEDLPAIWGRLVENGFESGHAYGKALRTVKSCVGSTWCRYGVQDSVGLAVELELRYRGLRAPHKIKAGVSGCARECAEAKGKDIGVIATEKGWNLYVGGNGGFTPRHAELLAGDLDKETLIRYIDRYLMYYIRTADRLQRTAQWIEALGGIQHLIDVVVGDSLGIASELESDMASHVASYSDEWNEVLSDPVKLERFQSFINHPDQSDSSITFVPERSQHRPATPVNIRTENAEAGFGEKTTGAGDRSKWVGICEVAHLTPDRPVAALIDGRQIAVVRTYDGSVYAVDNRDPFSGANVMSRGLVGSKQGKKVIISPMYKQAFDLDTGICIDDQTTSIRTANARVRSGKVEVCW